MEVFENKTGEEVLIGKVGEAAFVSSDLNNKIVDTSGMRYHAGFKTKLVVANWTPLAPVDILNVNVIEAAVNLSPLAVRQLTSILAMLVERNGGAMHVDASDLLVDRELKITHNYDPWGIVLKTEGT